MSDIMLIGILRCPFDTGGDVHLVQLQQVCHEAADRIESDTKIIDTANARIKELEEENETQNRAILLAHREIGKYQSRVKELEGLLAESRSGREEKGNEP